MYNVTSFTEDSKCSTVCLGLGIVEKKEPRTDDATSKGSEKQALNQIAKRFAVCDKFMQQAVSSKSSAVPSNENGSGRSSRRHGQCRSDPTGSRRHRSFRRRTRRHPQESEHGNLECITVKSEWTFAVVRCPWLAAMCSAVHPVSSAASTSAPLSTST